jgi:hypothetical protein
MTQEFDPSPSRICEVKIEGVPFTVAYEVDEDDSTQAWAEFIQLNDRWWSVEDMLSAYAIGALDKAFQDWWRAACRQALQDAGAERGEARKEARGG